jgi:hypothetical protein
MGKIGSGKPVLRSTRTSGGSVNRHCVDTPFILVIRRPAIRPGKSARRGSCYCKNAHLSRKRQQVTSRRKGSNKKRIRWRELLHGTDGGRKGPHGGTVGVKIASFMPWELQKRGNIKRMEPRWRPGRQGGIAGYSPYVRTG